MPTLNKIFALIIMGSMFALSGCGQSLYNMAKKSERGSAKMIEKNIQVDDHNIAYLEGGEGETILLVHGYAADKDNWTRFAAKLTGSYHVIAIDLPGFGDSSRIQTDSYDIDSQTDRLYHFAKALGLTRFHIVGNSMGGWLSGHFAAKYPEMIASLTLMNAAGVTSPNKSELTKALEKGFNPLLVDGVKDYDRLINFIFVKPPFIPNSVKKELARLAVKNRPFNEKVWADFTGKNLPLEPELKKIIQPTLIIWGDTDRVLDVSSVDVFLTGIRGSQKYIIKDCGHAPMLERPEETAQVFLEFIKNKK